MKKRGYLYAEMINVKGKQKKVQPKAQYNVQK